MNPEIQKIYDARKKAIIEAVTTRLEVPLPRIAKEFQISTSYLNKWMAEEGISRRDLKAAKLTGKDAFTTSSHTSGK
jgi:hypothetical protein